MAGVRYVKFEKYKNNYLIKELENMGYIYFKVYRVDNEYDKFDLVTPTFSVKTIRVGDELFNKLADFCNKYEYHNFKYDFGKIIRIEPTDEKVFLDVEYNNKVYEKLTISLISYKIKNFIVGDIIPVKYSLYKDELFVDYVRLKKFNRISNFDSFNLEYGEVSKIKYPAFKNDKGKWVLLINVKYKEKEHINLVLTYRDYKELGIKVGSRIPVIYNKTTNKLSINYYNLNKILD